MAHADAAVAGVVGEQAHQRTADACGERCDRLVVAEQSRPHHVDQPERPPPRNLLRRNALEVQPETRLDQIVRVRDRDAVEIRRDDLRGLAGALERAGVDLADMGAREVPAERVRLRDALLAERKVREVTVEDAVRVADVAVANQVETGRDRGFAHSRRCYGMAPVSQDEPL